MASIVAASHHTRPTQADKDVPFSYEYPAPDADDPRRFVYHRSQFYATQQGDGGVEVDGTFRGAFEVNATNADVDLHADGRTRELSFTYTVEKGHGTSALKYVAGSLFGNITSIGTDAAASLALPPVSPGQGLPVHLDPVNQLTT